MWACGLGGTMRDCLRANAGLLACFCVHCRCGSLKPHLVSQRGVKNCISYTASRYKKHNSLANATRLAYPHPCTTHHVHVHALTCD